MKFFLSYILLSLTALNFCTASPIRSRDASVEFSILSPQEGDTYSSGDKKMSLLPSFTNHAYSVSIVWVDEYSTLCNINIVEDNISLPIASDVGADQGQYLWTIPQNLSTSTQGLYHIQIVYGNSTISSGQFTIRSGVTTLSNDNSSSSNNAGAINKDPMSGAKATASITIIGAQDRQDSLGTFHRPGSYTSDLLRAATFKIGYWVNTIKLKLGYYIEEKKIRVNS
ncbi:hypothetical protein K501DRAFT_331536 [Backusella circina FSU 941]|nr:hypothetical protein K501DRAFT_331536 [Backusella circina FSU 941]